MSCVINGCDNEAECGPWCREHWDSQFERDVQINARQPVEHLARELATKDRIIQFLVGVDALPDFCDPGSGCGHLRQVHHLGGCAGLIDVGQGDWERNFSGCDCNGYLPWEDE